MKYPDRETLSEGKNSLKQYNTKHQEIQDEDEIPWQDIVRFFSRHGKLLILTTVGLSTLSIILALFLPKQYQKQLTLSVKPVPVPLSQPLPGLDVNQASNLAVALFQNQPRRADPKYAAKYNPLTQQIDLAIKSRHPQTAATAGPTVLSKIESYFKNNLEPTLNTSLTFTELQLVRSQQTLAQIDQQIAKAPADPPGRRTQARLEALENQRTALLSQITALEFDQDYLKQAQNNLDRLIPQIISVQILNESEVRKSSILKVAVLAIIASFMVAVLAAIIRDQVPRIKDQLSKQRFDNRGGV